MAFPILPFGASRFLQAHVDLFVSEALKRGEAMGRIVAVQTTQSAESRKRIAFFATGRPYIVQIKGFAEGGVVDEAIEAQSVGGGVEANAEWDEVGRLFNAARCVVSNTGDRGYERDPSDRADGQPPRSFPAKLASLLIARYRAAVLSVLDGWEASPAAQKWIGGACLWVDSPVDRIVSEPLEPAGAIAEPYALWAIEARPGWEPPCRHPDVVVTPDLARYERLKLFILNLGHTYLAELWRRRGGAPEMTVREAMADAEMGAELDETYETEVIPVFAATGMEAEARAYRISVVDRFRNPFLDHRLMDIFTNHEAETARRLGGLIALAEANNLRLNAPRLRAALAATEGLATTPAG